MKRYGWLMIGGVLAAAGVAGLIATWGHAEAYARANAQMPGSLAFEVLGSFLALLAGAVLAIIGGCHSWRFRQRARGRLTPAERALRDHQERQAAAAARTWADAVALAGDLAAGRVPAPLQVWGLVLREGEACYLSTRAFYSRWYGGDGSYTHVSGLFFGSPLFAATGYAVTALGNKTRRDAARAEAALRWREHQELDVLVTGQRIVCNVGGRWLSFDIRAASGFYPEPVSWSVTFDFPDTAPLRLSGLTAPQIAVLAAWVLHGKQGPAEHPALAALRQPWQTV